MYQVLRKINLNDNHFKFPTLPDTINEIYICNNYLKTISHLPSNLKKLFIGNNYLEENRIKRKYYYGY